MSYLWDCQAKEYTEHSLLKRKCDTYIGFNRCTASRNCW